MTDPGNIATASGGDYTAVSNNETTEQLTEALAEPESEQEPKEGKSASEIGKKGGEATAAIKRAKAREATKAEEAPEPEEEPDEDAEDLEPASDSEKPLGKPRHDPKARMLEATRKEAEAKREAKAAREETAALKARLEALEAPKAAPEPAKTPQAASGKPKLEDFATYDEWVEAITDYKADQKFKERDERVRVDRAVADYKAKIDTDLGGAVEILKEYEKTDPQWIERVSDEVLEIKNSPSFLIPRDKEGNYLEPLGPRNVIADEMIRAKEIGPLIMLHFSHNPEELQRLLQTTSHQETQVEMRILARSMKAAPGKKTVEVSNARPPVRPVAGTTRISDDAPDSEASYDAHRDYYNKREKRARA